MRIKHNAAAWLVVLFSLPMFAGAQGADASREKWEKVDEILAALRAAPGKNIADIGAGEGFYSLRIARAIGPGGRVSAVDVSEKYLEKLRATIQQEGITNIDVILGTVDDPRLAAGRFDAVLIYNSYHEMTAPESILKAIFAALKPGGQLVMSEPLHDNLRSATRAEQIKEHEISAEYVEKELQAVGFQISERRPDFLAFANPDHKGGFWLLVATKPKEYGDRESARAAPWRSPDVRHPLARGRATRSRGEAPQPVVRIATPGATPCWRTAPSQSF